MAGRRGVWVKGLTKEGKVAIAATCERFIAEVLIPRFLPQIRPKFDSPFARLDHVSGDRFDLMWHRHTGQWLCFRVGVSLAEALRLMETEGLVQPT